MLLGKFSAEALRHLRSLDPFGSDLAQDEFEWRTLRGPATVAEIREIYGVLLDYDLKALRALTQASDADADVVHRRLCDVDGMSCFDYGDVLTGLDRDADAAAVYQKGVATGLDEVVLSRRVNWLVDYEIDQGRAEAALSLARRAAETGSGSGLALLGWTCERLGRLEEAERAFDSLREAYGDPGFVLRFRVRAGRRAPGGSYDEKARMARLMIGLDRLPRVTLATIGQTPGGRGVMVLRSSPKFQKAGLERGDVIVAVDGVRVGSLDEYRAAMTLSDDPNVAVIVRSREGYKAVTAPLRRYHPAIGLR
jgi:hypothetical protein